MEGKQKGEGERWVYTGWGGGEDMQLQHRSLRDSAI